MRMRRVCRESFPRHRLQRKPLFSGPGRHHDSCVTHVHWCMSGALTRGGRGNVPGISGACATPNSTYLVRCPWLYFGGHPIFTGGNLIIHHCWKPVVVISKPFERKNSRFKWKLLLNITLLKQRPHLPGSIKQDYRCCPRHGVSNHR